MRNNKVRLESSRPRKFDQVHGIGDHRILDARASSGNLSQWFANAPLWRCTMNVTTEAASDIANNGVLVQEGAIRI